MQPPPAMLATHAICLHALCCHACTPPLGRPLPALQCNALMLILYTRSLRYNSSLACTAATTAVNISTTGLLGSALFGEATSLQVGEAGTEVAGHTKGPVAP